MTRDVVLTGAGTLDQPIAGPVLATSRPRRISSDPRAVFLIPKAAAIHLTMPRLSCICRCSMRSASPAAWSCRAMRTATTTASDWPHPLIDAAVMPDDGTLVDLFTEWTPDAAVREKILVLNAQRLYDFPELPERAASSLR